jgi:hypothetical protein
VHQAGCGRLAGYVGCAGLASWMRAAVVQSGGSWAARCGSGAPPHRLLRGGAALLWLLKG